MAQERATARVSWSVKLILCMVLDIADFFFGRLAIGLPIGEVLGAVIVVSLFGWKGLFYLLEVLDPTEQIDGFVPTATLIALAARKSATAS